MIRYSTLLTLGLGLSLPALTHGYPLDGYEDTGIRRLEASRLAHEGKIQGPKQPAGALLATDQVDLRLLDYRDLELPPPDPALKKKSGNI